MRKVFIFAVLVMNFIVLLLALFAVLLTTLFNNRSQWIILPLLIFGFLVALGLWAWERNSRRSALVFLISSVIGGVVTFAIARTSSTPAPYQPTPSRPTASTVMPVAQYLPAKNWKEELIIEFSTYPARDCETSFARDNCFLRRATMEVKDFHQKKVLCFAIADAEKKKRCHDIISELGDEVLQ